MLNLFKKFNFSFRREEDMWEAELKLEPVAE
jgi:hypothetical protein